ncbi:MAG: PQQ-dependent sugar dehydrogenase [Planctomycetota bacterium]
MNSFMTQRWNSIVCIGLGILFWPWHASSLHGQQDYDPKRLEKTTLVTGLIQPMEMAIAPDGSIYLIELAGQIKRIDPKTGIVSSSGTISVTTAQENGLIGLALDPNFATNRWMYLQYSPPDYSGQHISRFQVRTDGSVDLESESLLMKYEEQRQECCHHAGSMEFGPDGCLYIGTGDNTNPFGDSQGFAPIDEREDRGAFNGLRTAGNSNSYNGKVLRIRPLPNGGYEIPEGNLFPRDGSIGRPEIYVMGCRNPWRLNVDQQTGFLYWGDVGPDAGGDGSRGPRGYDEVNQARHSGNFGWPLFIGNNRPYLRVNFDNGNIGDAFDPSKPINFSRFNSGVKELPPAQGAFIYYPAGESAEFPAVGTGGRTACAGPVYYHQANLQSPTKLPAFFDRTLFIYEWSRNWIVAVHLNEDSSIRSMERFMPEETFVRPIDLQFDSHGSLYVIEYGETWGVNPDAKLVRVDYLSGNRPPTARIAMQGGAGKEPLHVHFSGAESFDRDGDTLQYAWRSVNSSDSTQAVSIGKTPEVEWTFTQPGIYNLELEVRDKHGAIDRAVVPVVVGNTIPKIYFASPKDGDFYDEGETVPYQIVVLDDEDGTSDVDASGAEDLEFIDAAAPDRVTVQANMIAAGANAQAEANLPPGLKLMRGSDCFNCHALDRAIVGPSFLDIANKYREQSGAMKVSIDRVLKGSTGVWGKVAMLPHSQHTPEQVEMMVGWVYGAKPDPTSQSVRGMSNQIELTTKAENAASVLKLSASYRDLGHNGIPPLVGSSTIELRPRTREVEAADKIHGMSELGSHKAGNGKFLGAIGHGSYFVLKDVPLRSTNSITFRVTSAGYGGDIVVHADALDGPVIATAHVDVNGDWDGWYDRTAPIHDAPDRASLYFECVNPDKGNGLMNIDSVRFNK